MTDQDQQDPPPAAGWWLYDGSGHPRLGADGGTWPDPPQWRAFNGGPDLPDPPDDPDETARRLGSPGVARPDRDQLDVINTALRLYRPLLVTGRPGVGKSSLAYQLARDLRLGRVLHWPITSRSNLQSGLYDYDAIGRAQAAAERPAGEQSPDGPESVLGDFIHLGPLGTALLPYRRPRVLLIDELDKSDIDLPNDLLNVFEDGMFSIPELIRARNRMPAVEVHTADPGHRAVIREGIVHCHAFPVVVITSNGERDFPPPFLRRCIRLDLPDPDEKRLADLVSAHFPRTDENARQLITAFIERRGEQGTLAADQLLNAVFLAASGARPAGDEAEWTRLLDTVWRNLYATGV
ncbi:AAA family ATPase [Solwaraspora sp. WMMB762]|uniref:AAA family ATPase n=1 Tax=Solwaraspora sp. WMMB762 TaxID=3404120 RepID=UPI003B942E54